MRVESEYLFAFVSSFAPYTSLSLFLPFGSRLHGIKRGRIEQEKEVDTLVHRSASLAKVDKFFISLASALSTKRTGAMIGSS